MRVRQWKHVGVILKICHLLYKNFCNELTRCRSVERKARSRGKGVAQGPKSFAMIHDRKLTPTWFYLHNSIIIWFATRRSSGIANQKKIINYSHTRQKRVFLIIYYSRLQKQGLGYCIGHNNRRSSYRANHQQFRWIITFHSYFVIRFIRQYYIIKCWNNLHQKLKNQIKKLTKHFFDFS